MGCVPVGWRAPCPAAPGPGANRVPSHTDWLCDSSWPAECGLWEPERRVSGVPSSLPRVPGPTPCWQIDCRELSPASLLSLWPWGGGCQGPGGRRAMWAREGEPDPWSHPERNPGPGRGIPCPPQVEGPRPQPSWPKCSVGAGEQELGRNEVPCGSDPLGHCGASAGAGGPGRQVHAECGARGAPGPAGAPVWGGKGGRAVPGRWPSPACVLSVAPRQQQAPGSAQQRSTTALVSCSIPSAEISPNNL